MLVTIVWFIIGFLIIGCLIFGFIAEFFLPRQLRWVDCISVWDRLEYQRHSTKVEREELAELIAAWGEAGETEGLSGAEIDAAARSELRARSQRLLGAKSIE